MLYLAKRQNCTNLFPKDAFRKININGKQVSMLQAKNIGLITKEQFTGEQLLLY